MDDFINQLESFLVVLKANLVLSLILVAVFWLIYLLTVLTGYRLYNLGNYPRRLRGLPGIVCANFLHADFNHLFFNSIPLLVLIDCTLLEGLPNFLMVSSFIIVASGVAVWLLARPALHLGASTLVMGYFGYLLINAYRHPSLASILLALLCLYYFGSLLLGVLPTAERISWEGHLAGFLAGLAAGYWIF